ncbi:hypothetical protein PGS49_23590, partial [Yersinia intermedia]|nr:hypothetical protein [Yersinia intermedia]
LFCEYCRLKIGVVIDPLTKVISFVHAPGSLENVKRLTTCRFSSANDRQGKCPTNPVGDNQTPSYSL